ncbi:stalk domain-containing protein [Brevibacillus ginsengisoli]|uniref:stalk domain-containing protein n=1 Tax=Brevibacillus ginsengisoli TaxID=363854 RepID=UPI003CEA2447
MKKLVSFLIVMLLAVSLNASAIFADSNSQVVIKLKVGSSDVSINGAPATIEKPYLLNNMTMVPLSVVTKAFEASLSFDSKTQTVGLIYGNKSIQFKAGSNKAKVNGKEVLLPVSPQLKNNTMMVPLKFVADSLGASIAYDKKTGDIVITGTSGTQSIPANSFNEDTGKTKIGDSYNSWSMKYPSGLVKEDQSFKGNWVSFKDAKNEYSLRIYVEEDQPEGFSNDGLVQKLTEDLEDTILSKGFVKEGKLQYARAITKAYDNSITEQRAYQQKDKIYYVMLTFEKEELYKNQLKYRVFKDLLDSFTPSFDQNDKTIKDISGVKDNVRSYLDENFGVSLKLPASWDKNDRVDYLYFGNKDLSEVVKIKITSITEKDTLDNWVARHEQMYRDELTEGSIEADKEIQQTTVAGVPARERNYKTAFGDKWYLEHDFFLFKGNYKYYVEVGYMKDSDAKEIDALIRSVKNSLVIDPSKMNPSLGFIQDEDMIDKSKTITIKNEKFNYSIEIPEYWKKGDAGVEGGLSYSFFGGDFNLVILPMPQDVASKEFEKYFEQKKQLNANFQVTERTTLNKFGVTVNKYMYKIESNGFKWQTVSYLFSKGEFTYAFDMSMKDENRSKANLERIDKAFESFKFLK